MSVFSRCWRRAALCMAVVGTLSGLGKNAAAQSSQWDVDEVTSFAEAGDWMVEESGFSGVGKLETWYTPRYRGNDGPGSIEYPPGELRLHDRTLFDFDSVPTGIVRNESSYAYLVSNAGAPSILTYEISGGIPSLRDSAPVEGGNSYRVGVGDPKRDVGYLGRDTAPIVDEVALGARTEGERQVLRTFDFSQHNSATLGGVTTSLLDAEKGIAMFGFDTGGSVGIMHVDSPEPTISDLIQLPGATGEVSSLALDTVSDTVFFAHSSPPIVYSYSRATTATASQYLRHTSMAGITGSVEFQSIFVDEAFRALYVIASDSSVETMSFWKYNIDGSGELLYQKTGTVDYDGGKNPIFDWESRLFYLTGRKAGATSLLRYRLSSSSSAFPEFAGQVSITSESPSRDFPFSFSSADGRFGHFCGYGTGLDSEIVSFELNRLFDRSAAVIMNRILWGSHWATGMRLYTHAEGGKVRLALYEGSASWPVSLLWQSEELDSKVGYVTVEIPPEVLKTGPGRPDIWAAFQISDVSVLPGYSGYGTLDSGWTGSFEYGPFPDRTTTISGGRVLNEKYAIGIRYQSNCAISSIAVQDLVSGWTNSRSPTIRIYGVGGEPDVFELSEDETFTTYTTFLGYGSNVYLDYPLSSPDSISGAEITLYARARNAYSVSVVRSDLVKLDFTPPFKPAPPIPSTNLSLDGYIHFDLGTTLDYPGGIGFGSHELQVKPVSDEGTTSSSDITGVTRSTGSLYVTAHRRIQVRSRGVDRVGNVGEWSDYSSTIVVNDVPKVRDLSYSPQPPRTSDLIVPSFTIEDEDAISLGTSVSWRRRNPPGNETLTTPTLSSTHTSKGQEWELRVKAIDDRKVWSQESVLRFTIANTLPTQPFVTIIPRTPDPNEDLVVDIQTYSFDADGDPLSYDFKWFKSTDGGATFIEKAELRGSPQVSKNFINEGDVWEVNYIPFERNSVKSTKGEVERIEGIAAKDRVYVGRNALPEFRVSNPTGKTLLVQGMNSTIDLTLFWDFFDADGEECFVDIYWTDKLESGLVPLAKNLPAEDRRYLSETILTNDRPIHIQAEIRDAKGAVVRVITPAIIDGNLGNLFMAY